MFDNRRSLIDFIEDFSKIINHHYIAPYITESMIDDLENQLARTLPISFRQLILLINFDNFQLGTTLFGDGASSFLDYLVKNNDSSDEYLKIAAGEMGNIVLSTKSGEVWSQYYDGDISYKNKLANDFEKFLIGYAYIQKNRLENKLTLDKAAKLVAKNVGSDDYRVWLHSII